MGVQKHLFVSGSAIFKELQKLKERLFVHCTNFDYRVRDSCIKLAGSHALRIWKMKLFRNIMFNVWKRFSRDQELFVSDLQA